MDVKSYVKIILKNQLKDPSRANNFYEKFLDFLDEFKDECMDAGSVDGYRMAIKENREISEDDLDEAREEGYEEGYEEGRRIGYEEGRRIGHNDGHEEGFEEGYDEGFSEGYREGIERYGN